MIAKLALRNIRRSLRDYAIYFVTLVFGVAVFFAFNSISTQRVLFDLLDNATDRIFVLTDYMMGLFSVVVACVLGFLVIYANRFLIRRRKREFGIYLTLGMSPGAVSRIVLLETVIVGIGALALGLLIGIGLSQGLAFVTAALFGTTMTHYEFIFSVQALIWTLISFTAIFVIVALFNTLTVSRLKLIDLLYASSRNERTPVRNPILCTIGFIASIVVLAASYQALIENGMVEMNDQFFVATALMLVGTLLLFWSGAGLVIAILTKIRGVYLRGLRPFTVRQIASKVNTAFISLWAIAVLLFFSITVFSTGMGLVKLFTADIEAATPYDVTLRTDYYPISAEVLKESSVQPPNAHAEIMKKECPELYSEAASYDFDPLAMLEQRVNGWERMVNKAALVEMWSVPEFPYKDLLVALEQADVPLTDDDRSLFASVETNVEAISLSNYNALCSLVDKKPLDLEPGHYALINNVTASQSVAEKIASAGLALDFSGDTLSAQSQIEDLQISTQAMLGSILIFIVPDEVASNLKAQCTIPFYSYTNVQLVDASPEGEEAFKQALYDSLKSPSWPVYDQSLGQGQLKNGQGFEDGSLVSYWPVTSELFSSEMRSQAGGLRMLITYLALYIGFVLLVATAAILAIQQLSEAADSQDRYALLSAIGCDRTMLSRSLFAQVLVYFAAPLVVACCHSAVAIGVMSQNLFAPFGIEATAPILLAALLVLAVYGVYFLVTYAGARMLIFRNQDHRQIG